MSVRDSLGRGAWRGACRGDPTWCGGSGGPRSYGRRLAGSPRSVSAMLAVVFFVTVFFVWAFGHPLAWSVIGCLSPRFPWPGSSSPSASACGPRWPPGPGRIAVRFFGRWRVVDLGQVRAVRLGDQGPFGGHSAGSAASVARRFGRCRLRRARWPGGPGSGGGGAGGRTLVFEDVHGGQVEIGVDALDAGLAAVVRDGLAPDAVIDPDAARALGRGSGPDGPDDRRTRAGDGRMSDPMRTELERTGTGDRPPALTLGPMAPDDRSSAERPDASPSRAARDEDPQLRGHRRAHARPGPGHAARRRHDRRRLGQAPGRAWRRRGTRSRRATCRSTGWPSGPRKACARPAGSRSSSSPSPSPTASRWATRACGPRSCRGRSSPTRSRR